jgi:hypothetical protein
VLRYILVKFQYDYLIYVFGFLHVSQFYKVLAKILLPNFLLNVHHFSYFTNRFGIILPSLVSGTIYFASLFIYIDSLRFIFMISISDFYAARSQEPRFMLHKLVR